MQTETERGDLGVNFHDERIDMAYWYPMLRELDVPTPETQPLPLDRSGEGPPEWDTELAVEIVENLGGEAFARSGYKSAQMHHSGSHIRESTKEAVSRTLMELGSQHAMMHMPMGESLWLREWLDLDWCGYTRENLVPEARVFIRDGEVVCYHPRLEGFDGYEDHRETAEQFIENAWPEETDDGVYRTQEGLETYAERVADEFEGRWSVDFVMDRNGDWYCTDMALDGLHYREDKGWINVSEHARGCEHNLAEQYADELEPPEAEQ